MLSKKMAFFVDEFNNNFRPCFRGAFLRWLVISALRLASMDTI